MLSFVVFDGDAPARERPLRHAHLVGADAVPAAGDIRFENGLIICTKTTSDAAALAVQADLGPAIRRDVETAGDEAGELPTHAMGVLTLQTCLLPDRDRPYLLSLELARHRIMLFLNKLEEWHLFDMPTDHPVMVAFERARADFTAALVAQHPPHVNGMAATDPSSGADAFHDFTPRAARLATRALWRAVDAGERLALLHAAADFPGRVTGQTYARAAAETHAGRGTGPIISPQRPGVILQTRPIVGATIGAAQRSEPLCKAVTHACDFISMPMRWVDMEPSEGTYNYAHTDKWIEWAIRTARLPVAAGPVIDFRPSAMPEWLYIWENDYETMRELVYEHITSIVTRYRRTVGLWTIASGLHANANLQLSFEQMIDLTRLCVLRVKKLHPAARVQIELVQPWGEYYTANRRALPPLLYAEMVAQAGIQIDGFGLRVQMGRPEGGQSTRDMMAFSAMLDRYAELDKPISLAAVGAPSTPSAPNGASSAANGNTNGSSDTEDPNAAGGYWRTPWDERAQADWATGVLGVALAKPYIQSVCWQELTDGPRPFEMPGGGITRAAGEPKPVAERMAELRAGVRTGKTPPSLIALAGTPADVQGLTRDD